MDGLAKFFDGLVPGLRELATRLLLWLRRLALGDRRPQLTPAGDLSRRIAKLERRVPAGDEADTGPLGQPEVDPHEDPVARYARGTSFLVESPFEGLTESPLPPTRQAWMAALLEDHGVPNANGGTSAHPTGAEATVGPAVAAGGEALKQREWARELRPGQRLALLELKGNPGPEELRALRAFPAGTIPPGTPEQRELVHAVFDRQKVHLLQRIAAEPLFAYGCRRWKPGQKDQNMELAQVLHERLAKLMGSLYDFDPAPLATGTVMPRRMHACYDETSGQLFLSHRHLNGTVGDFMEALAHQQAHCLQHGLIRRLHELPEGEPRQVVAKAWAADFERWRATCLPLSIGYFAHDLGGAVGKLVRGIDLEERSAGV